MTANKRRECRASWILLATFLVTFEYMDQAGGSPQFDLLDLKELLGDQCEPGLEFDGNQCVEIKVGHTEKPNFIGRHN